VHVTATLIADQEDSASTRLERGGGGNLLPYHGNLAIGLVTLGHFLRLLA
jgi:hypothetical protein